MADGRGPGGIPKALSKPCPKCGAPIGHRCRPLKSSGQPYAGQRKVKPHPERLRDG